jgi:hypothetical protein
MGISSELYMPCLCKYFHLQCIKTYLSNPLALLLIESLGSLIIAIL